MKIMKKAIVLAMVLVTLVAAGCGEEEKYNKLKVELNPKLQAYSQLSASGTDAEYSKRTSESRKEVEKLLAEMKKLSVSENKLTNDYLATEKLWNQIVKSKDEARRNIVATDRMKSEVRDKDLKFGCGW